MKHKHKWTKAIAEGRKGVFRFPKWIKLCIQCGQTKEVD